MEELRVLMICDSVMELMGAGVGEAVGRSMGVIIVIFIDL
jgi:hypothetical protein